MEKIKISKEGFEAIKQGAIHWRQDVYIYLLSGDKIKESIVSGLVWEKNNKEVPCYRDSCPLCSFSSPDCKNCPYVIGYGVKCNETGEPWLNFINNPNLETAGKMVERLEELLTRVEVE